MTRKLTWLVEESIYRFKKTFYEPLSIACLLFMVSWPLESLVKRTLDFFNVLGQRKSI